MLLSSPPPAVSTGCTGPRTLACAPAVSECSRKRLHGFLALRDPVPRRCPAGQPLSSPPVLLCPQCWHVVTSALTSPPRLLTQPRGPPWPLLVGSIIWRGWCFSQGLCAGFKLTLSAWEQRPRLGAAPARTPGAPRADPPHIHLRGGHGGVSGHGAQAAKPGDSTTTGSRAMKAMGSGWAEHPTEGAPGTRGGGWAAWGEPWSPSLIPRAGGLPGAGRAAGPEVDTGSERGFWGPAQAGGQQLRPQHPRALGPPGQMCCKSPEAGSVCRLDW